MTQLSHCQKSLEIASVSVRFCVESDRRERLMAAGLANRFCASSGVVSLIAYSREAVAYAIKSDI